MDIHDSTDFVSLHIQTCDTSEAEVHEPDVWRPQADDETKRCDQCAGDRHNTTSELIGQGTGDWPCTHV